MFQSISFDKFVKLLNYIILLLGFILFSHVHSTISCFSSSEPAKCKTNTDWSNILMASTQKKHHIEIYTREMCSYCIKAKNLLKLKDIDFVEINLDMNPEKIAEMISRAQRKTVPQIFIDNKHIGGCDDLYELESNGKLNSILS